MKKSLYSLLFALLLPFCAQAQTIPLNSGGGTVVGGTGCIPVGSAILRGDGAGGCANVSEVGSGAAVLADSPTLITPNIGAATGTSLELGDDLKADNLWANSQSVYMNATGTVFVKAGAGSPEGVVSGSPGSIWINTTGGADVSLWRKESGAGDTGWVAIENRDTAAEIGFTPAGSIAASTVQAAIEEAASESVTGGQSGVLTKSGNNLLLENAVRNLSGRGCSDPGGDDAYSCNMGVPDSAYILNALYTLIPATANNGAASVDYSSLGVRDIKKFISGSKADPATGDICAGHPSMFIYDGTHMVLVSTLCNPSSGSITATGGTILKAGGAGASTTGVDSGIVDSGSAYVFDKPIEACGGSPCLFNMDTAIFATTPKTWDYPVNADDTYVGEAAAQTLTNKTINGSNNTITNLPVSSVVNALKDEVKNFTILTPTTGDTDAVQIQFGAAVTLQKVSCSTRGASSTATIQFDKRAEATPNTSGTDALTSALVCDTDRQSTTSFSSAGVAANQVLNFQITGTANDPEVVRVHIHARLD